MSDDAMFTIEPADPPRIIGGPVQLYDSQYRDHGYGFAYGGGIGSYAVCPNDRCDWFIKELDRDVE